MTMFANSTERRVRYNGISSVAHTEMLTDPCLKIPACGTQVRGITSTTRKLIYQWVYHARPQRSFILEKVYDFTIIMKY